MYPNWNLFLIYETVFKCVIMENNLPCRIVSIRRVENKMFVRTMRTLDDVRHIPNLKRILSPWILLNQKITCTLMQVKFWRLIKTFVFCLRDKKSLSYMSCLVPQNLWINQRSLGTRVDFETGIVFLEFGLVICHNHH